ncbi:MAG: hypothetical protein NTZ63_06980 [Candidatus Omnitrophica bacterium]|nr:hypothetical protein [Candidatus Omnitrophota bacterium]
MRKFSVLLILLCLATSLLGCQLLGWRKYTNRDARFSLYIPRSWEIDEEDTEANAAFVAYAPKQGITDNFATNIRVVAEELPAEIPLTTYYDINRAEFEQVFKKLDDVKEGQGMTGFVRYQWLAFTALVGEDILIRAISTVWISGKRVYVLTCVTNLRRAPQIEPVYRRILSSFRIL